MPRSRRMSMCAASFSMSKRMRMEGGGDCPTLALKKYVSRPGPPRPANEPGCRGQVMLGNDGFLYKSTAASNGVYRWVALNKPKKASSKSSSTKSSPKKSPKKASPKKAKSKASPKAKAVKECGAGKIRNPATGRCVSASGKIGLALLK